MASIAALGILSPDSPSWAAASKTNVVDGGNCVDEGVAAACDWKRDEKDFFQKRMEKKQMERC